MQQEKLEERERYDRRHSRSRYSEEYEDRRPSKSGRHDEEDEREKEREKGKDNYRERVKEDERESKVSLHTCVFSTSFPDFQLRYRLCVSRSELNPL